MEIDILSKNQVKKLIEERTRIEFNKIQSYLNKLNQRMMRIEEEFKVRRYLKKTKKEGKNG